MRCERCGAKTTGGKPLCPQHVTGMPYAAGLTRESSFQQESDQLALEEREQQTREDWLKARRRELRRAHESSRLNAFQLPPSDEAEVQD